MNDYCKILIIDDEYIMRQGIKHMLDWERQGFQIVGEAANGKEGLELLASLHPHIVLCDIVMPQMDGVDFSKVVQKIYPEIQIIILSSYDNFNYVKGALQNGAVDYVLKPTLNPQELLGVLKTTAMRIPGMILMKEEGVSLEKSLEDYLMGNSEEFAGPEIVERFPYTFYRVFGMCIRQRNLKGQDISSILYEKAMDYMKDCKYAYIAVLLREEMLCVVLNFRAGDRDDIVQFMDRLTGQMTVFHSRIYGVLSHEFSTRSMIKEIYDGIILPEADKAFYYQGKNLRIIEEKKTAVQMPKFDFNWFSKYLDEKRYREALDLLYGYACEGMKACMEEFRFKNQIKNMIFSLIDAMDMSRNRKEEMRYRYFKQIDSTVYVEEFSNVLDEIRKELNRELVEGTPEDDYRIRQILQYIAQNYTQDLDLAEIAKVFNFNYYYLSAYFNQHMEAGFSEYVNSIRIKQSCRLLREKDLSISQVSNEVGYSDPSYFCRVFKKVTGDTPSTWRRSHRQER